MDTPARDAPIGLSALLAYGSPALPLAALTLPTYILLPKFYASEVGLGLASVGLILLLARIWDVISDPDNLPVGEVMKLPPASRNE